MHGIPGSLGFEAARVVVKVRLPYGLLALLPLGLELHELLVGEDAAAAQFAVQDLVLDALVLFAIGIALGLGLGLGDAPLVHGLPPLVDGGFEGLPRLVLGVDKEFERLHEVLHQEVGNGLVGLGRGLHVLGDKMPGVADGAVHVLGRLEELGRELREALGVVDLELCALVEGVDELLGELAALLDEDAEVVEALVAPLVGGIHLVQGEGGPPQARLGDAQLGRHDIFG